jgi:prevent-host-death family protein
VTFRLTLARQHQSFSASVDDDYNDHYDYPRGEGAMESDTWTVAEAKAKFSEVMDQAQVKGPQTITRNGRHAVVVVSAQEWERKTRRTGNLADFFAASPLRRSKLKTRRSKHGLRATDL